MKMFRHILAVALLAFAGVASLSAESKSATVRFRFGKSEADLSRLEAILSGPDSSRIVGIELRSASSPDGPYWVNKTLAEERASFIINKVKELCPSLGDDAIKSTVVAEDWVGVARRLRKSDKVWKDEALKIVTESEASTREEKLQDLYAGEAWDDLMKTVFPALRSAEITVILADEAESVPESKVSLEEEDVRVLFPAGIRYVRPEFADNSLSLKSLKSLASSDKPLTIKSYSSPEGAPSANAALAKNRANCVRDYLTSELGVDAGRITIVVEGEDWGGLLREVEAGYEGANRDDVVKILSDDSLSGGQKKAAVRALDGGSTWQKLIATQMPKLRAVSVSAE